MAGDAYLDNLNDPQRQAVECTEGPVMIIAGAGSGKTRVLTYRIVHLLKKGVDPFNILALTFTNKAAREMKSRIAAQAGEESRNLWMGTFHSVFARLLRAEGERLGYPSNFAIYDTDDSKSLIRNILKEMGLDDKVYKPSSVLGRISAAKNNLMSWSDYQASRELVSADEQGNRPLLGAVFEKYAQRCFKAGAMDFDDLLYNMYVLLRNFPDRLDKYQDKFRYVLLDEFQDTNYAQYVIVRKIAARHENICVVGDDAQSIYAFRGANIQNILSFGKDYPDLNIFKLEQNYRSTKNIVGAANSVIVNNRRQLRKEVWTGNAEGEKVRVLRALSDNEEGSLVAHAIYGQKMNHQLKASDFAVLYRTNAQSRSLEEALRRLNIPYRIYGGVSFYARREIKDLLAYFRLAVNPRDEEALRRVINYPARGIGKASIDKLVIAADRNGKSIWEVIRQLDTDPAGIASGTREKIADFAAMIESFHAELPKKDAYDLASHIASRTGILKDLYNDRTPEGISHYENIQELLNGIKEFADKGVTALPAPSEELTGEGLRTLDLFLQDIALLTDAETQDDTDTEKVSLMTVHMAKGLEFKQVFVTGLEENLFPSQMSMNSREDLEEERRLFYVAMTRAEERLTVTWSATRYRWGKLVHGEPSRFLDEIDPKYLEVEQRHWTPDEETAWEFPAQPLVMKPRPEKRKDEFVRGNWKPLKKIIMKNDAGAQDFSASDPGQIVAGMEVEHQKFGAGKVIQVEGELPEAKAIVFFKGFGNKKLLLKYAKLKIVK